ncbi:CBM9 family sugar-binding protein [Glaciecola sp. MH2013]|nr:CBM9 family sugar-binding protein [Glaciecola sp. MH2013]
MMTTGNLAHSIAVIDDASKALTPIYRADEAIVIDAKALESAWQKASWRALDQVLIGENLSEDDFNGRYKLLWDSEALYLLVELQDDVLADSHPDPLVNYWDDDCVEVFIDEDASGGDHQFNYNAFAYHVGLDRHVSDMGPTATSSESVIQTYNDHIQSQWSRALDTHTITWELKISIFDDSFLPNSDAKPQVLKQHKEMGFMLAYCDADGKGSREHFIGSYPIEGINGDKNLGYKTADVFEKVQLVK